ncbi:RIB43A-like with coiled-coils protein 2 [Centroberyx gerrardi]|uniref:RIB43A-like with coiled-coils protein 2 n=1 Tax=Centroberyx gerrardi TaxID=166262 RepID=UPI003AB0A801
MFNVELLSDRVAAASLEKRRNREMQRQERIFNAKVRTTGIDKEALDCQVKEKEKRAEAEEESLNACAADMLHDSKAACLLNSRQVKEERVMEKAVAQYRQHFQQPWSQREHDLNDPERCRNTDRDGAQMMPPGLVGEDPGSKDRLKRQKEQLRDWLVQQQYERAAARHQQRLEEQQYDQSRVNLDNKALQLEKIEQQRRKAAALATKDYNLAKWGKTEERRRRERERDDEDNQADILNHLQGELIGEDAAPVLGVLGVPCLRPSVDKRAPPQSLEQVIQFQKYQTEEKKRIESEKRQEEERQDRFRVDSARTALLLERQQARLNKQLRRDLDSTNAKLAEAQKQQEQALEKSCSPDDGFFTKFNTSSR